MITIWKFPLKIEREQMPVAIVGTGHPIPWDGVHRGSFNQGSFVWHVFTQRGFEASK